MFSRAWFCPCLLCSKEKQLKRKEAKAEVAAQLENAIEKELLARLQVRLAGCFKSWRGLGKAACQLACPSRYVSNRTLLRLHLPCWPSPQSGTYGDIYNFPQRQYEKALAQVRLCLCQTAVQRAHAARHQLTCRWRLGGRRWPCSPAGAASAIRRCCMRSGFLGLHMHKIEHCIGPVLFSNCRRRWWMRMLRRQRRTRSRRRRRWRRCALVLGVLRGQNFGQKPGGSSSGSSGT